MSIRGTPSTSFTNHSFSLSPSGIPNTSADASTSRMRPTRNGSFALTLVTETSRRQSGFSSRNMSGTSTPSNRRAKQKLGASIGDRDWAGMEPDEVFRRLPVGEVKKVEAKMRGDAMNKQSELRSMVGTRYRDLLTSATQITSLHSSSLHLSSSLRTVAQACSNPSEVVVTGDDDSGDQSDAEDVMSTLPVAAHMKLLLDAPEALYSYLSHRAYLSAALLWLVTRVTKEGLSNMPEDVSAPYSPLLQKQWETLLPFRGQIVQRATAALRSREKQDAKMLSETLLSIIILDNLPLADALALLLSQRAKTVRDILAHSPDQSTSTPHLSPVMNRRRGNSRASEISVSREVIASVLTEAIQCMLDTAITASSVFDKRKQSQEGESLIEEMVRLVQVGEPVTAPPQSAIPLRRTSHQRRASRLVSISLPFPKVDISSGSPPVSTRQILQSLPSSQILLRHLPNPITAFTPFITPSPPVAVSQKIAAWRETSTQILRDALPTWLTALNSVTDICHVRDSLRTLLHNGEYEAEIRVALEAEWGARVKDVWGDKLEHLVQSAETCVREAGEKIWLNGEELETDATAFMFSELPFPAAPTTSMNTSYTAFNTFLSTLKKRSSHRTPLLDSVLAWMEVAGASLKADTQGLPKGLISDYRERVAPALEKLINVLRRVLESMGSGRGDGKHGIEAELFVGRVALYLGKASTFVADIVGDADVATGVIEAFVRIHSESTTRWQRRATLDAIALLGPLFDPYRGPFEVRASWQGPQPMQPSSQIMKSLRSLVASVGYLGVPPGVDLPIVADLVKGFVDDARGLDGWALQKDEAAVQAAFDLAFLGMIGGEQLGKDMVAQKFLAKVRRISYSEVFAETPQLPSTIPGDFAEALPSLLADALRRTQLLLHPLLVHLDPALLPPPTAVADTRGGLLRFGPPSIGKAGTGTEFRSPIAVARPGKRFGLLSIAA